MLISLLRIIENKFNGNNTKEYYKLKNGHKVGLPVYWRNKIYTESQREKLWIKKLDENVRWIDGIKIDVSTTAGLRRENEIREIAQRDNDNLGFGKLEKWKEVEYKKEKERMKRENCQNPNGVKVYISGG